VVSHSTMKKWLGRLVNWVWFSSICWVEVCLMLVKRMPLSTLSSGSLPTDTLCSCSSWSWLMTMQFFVLVQLPTTNRQNVSSTQQCWHLKDSTHCQEQTATSFWSSSSYFWSAWDGSLLIRKIGSLFEAFNAIKFHFNNTI
jgi:hypothetical protein